MELNYNTPPVLFVGLSGTGKSTAIETLPPKRTLIINTENKMMPFRNHSEFSVVDIKGYSQLMEVMRQLLSKEGSEAFDYVILDSFTSLTEIIEAWANASFSGFSQWKEYNGALQSVIKVMKQLPQQVFVIGIPEREDVEFGSAKMYLRVKGKELKYQIEKEFSVVLFTNPIYDEESGEMMDVEMMYKPNRLNTAKSPQGMFEIRPANDMLLIADRIKKYYDVS